MFELKGLPRAIHDGLIMRDLFFFFFSFKESHLTLYGSRIIQWLQASGLNFV